MDRISVYFFERGLPGNVPGFKENYPAAAFPFWGNYYFLDFALANFRGAPVGGRYVVTDSRFRSLVASIAGRWESDGPEIRTLEKGLDSLLQWLAEDPADVVVLSTLSFVSAFSVEDLLQAAAGMEGGLIKLTLGHVPVDLFVARKNDLQVLLEQFRGRVLQSRAFEHVLFEDVLLPSFDLIVDVPGRVLFQNSLHQLVQENLWLLAHTGSDEHGRIAGRMSAIKAPDRETVIEGSAHIRNSLICAGAQVEGYVEDSLVFPNVQVRKGARVVRSLVMNNNRIGSRSTVENAVIFPCSADSAKYASNIGEAAVVGTSRSAAQNEEFPEQIHGGLTVLGMDVELPGGITVEPGCFVAADVSHQHVKGLKKLRRGSSVYPERRR